MEKQFYVVEDYNSGEYFGFTSLSGVRNFMTKHYIEKVGDWYNDYDGTNEELITSIKEDLINLTNGDYCYIEDVMYCRPVQMMEE